MSIEKRIKRLEAILDARGLDWDHPRVEEEPLPVDFGDKDHPVVMRQTMVFSLSQSDKNQPVKEPPKKWRILEVGEVVQEGDRVTTKTNPPSDPPNGLGWCPVDASVGTSVFQGDPCIFARLVSDEPAKEPEHRAGPKPDPGEGYRLLSKDPPEELAEGDDFWFSSYSEWHKSFHATLGITSQPDVLWYRRKIEQPKPAWEPKVGDWVLVTRPENWKEWKDILWREEMHIYDGKVFQVVGAFETLFGHRVKLHGIDWFFHRDWLSPSIKHFAEPPAIDKPPEPEYREPVLPADGGMACEFSEEGDFWSSGRLGGVRIGRGWFSTGGVCWRHCRIKKDA